ncbi:hypothetical protein BKA65DRAFT_552352 [Rhexocercosporidium sp. MPI-PUGE-AT-0058]|nr:hypothetical protein BKA65DRAFT_552352 [Rhexocercosporidium sp. MPI-PUGE-AT-0058]
MYTSAPTDMALVAPLTYSEVTRASIEKAKFTLESPSSTAEEREFAISELEEIYALPTTSRTNYHFGCVCYLLAMYSPKDIMARKNYAYKCLAEVRKKLSKISGDKKEPFKDEYSVSEQLFKGLQKKARLALEKIGTEVRRARAEGKLLEPKWETHHVKKKKKKVSWGGADIYDDDEDYQDEDDEDDDYEGEGEGEGEGGFLGSHQNLSHEY